MIEVERVFSLTDLFLRIQVWRFVLDSFRTLINLRCRKRKWRNAPLGRMQLKKAVIRRMPPPRRESNRRSENIPRPPWTKMMEPRSKLQPNRRRREAELNGSATRPPPRRRRPRLKRCSTSSDTSPSPPWKRAFRRSSMNSSKSNLRGKPPSHPRLPSTPIPIRIDTR